MVTSLLIKDETATGKVVNQSTLFLSSDVVTVRDIIEARVLAEVGRYNSKASEYFSGVGQPVEAEHTLNGYRVPKNHLIDPEKQVYIALDAFQKNAYFILIDDQQVESLTQEVVIRPDSSMSFVQLVPLVGG